MQAGLLRFLRAVPEDFGMLHLGFLWESQEERQSFGNSGLVFKTHKAVGRHAYMVTRSTAQTLLRLTIPQRDAGDQLYLDTIKSCKINAYQPKEPLFRQDREVFPISEITGFYRPARDFAPPPDELRRWQAEAALARQKRSSAGKPQVSVNQL